MVVAIVERKGKWVIASIRDVPHNPITGSFVQRPPVRTHRYYSAELGMTGKSANRKTFDTKETV